MKQQLINIALVSSLSICFFTSVHAQEVLSLDRSKVKADPSIPQAMLGALSVTLEKAVRDYATYCTLYDRDSKSVNSISINNFVSLFDPSSAMVCKDFLFDSISTLVDINDYFIDVMDGPIKTTGIQAEIINPILSDVSRDLTSGDQVVSKIILTKVLKNYVQDGATGYFYKPVERKLILTYKTASYYLEEALISSIEYYSPTRSPKPDPILPAPSVAVVQRQGNCSLIDPNTILPKGVDEDTLMIIENLICDALGKYKASATMIDSTTNTVTGASASRFQQLFTSGASLHIADFREYPDNIEVSAYREDVFKFFRSTGISFELTNPRIKSISYDPDGFFFVDVEVTKYLPYYLEDESYDIKKSNKNRSFILNISYLIVKRNMSDPLIEKAISNSIVKPEEKKTLISFGPNLSIGLISGTPMSGYEYITDNTTLSSTFGLGFQVDLMSNFLAKHRSTKKPLFLTVGLGLQTFTIQAAASNIYNTRNLMTIDGIEGRQLREIIELKDQIPMKIIGMPLGIEYRLFKTKNNNLELFLGGKIVPSYSFGIHSSFNAEGFYNLTYDQLGFSFYNEDKVFMLKPSEQMAIDNTYGIGSFNLEDNKGTELPGKFLLGYKLETSMLASLSASFMLNIKLGFGGFLGDIIQSSEIPPDFPFQEKPKSNQIVERNTLLQDYYTNIAINDISLTIGLAYKLQ